MVRFALAAALTLIGLPAIAQNGAPDSEGGRYSFTKVDDGHLRLDQQNGQVSLCTRRNVGWACHPVPDERTALEEEIGRLQRDNAAMKKELLARGILLPGMKQPQAQSDAKPNAKPDPDADVTIKVPTDADLDKAMAVMERIWRRLVEMVQRVQKELVPPI